MEVAYLTGELLKRTESPARPIKKHFGWLSNADLYYVLVGKPYSAALIENGIHGRYVLYFNHKRGKFEFSFDTPQEYLVVDKLWVNSDVAPIVAR